MFNTHTKRSNFKSLLLPCKGKPRSTSAELGRCWHPEKDLLPSSLDFAVYFLEGVENMIWDSFRKDAYSFPTNILPAKQSNYTKGAIQSFQWTGKPKLTLYAIECIARLNGLMYTICKTRSFAGLNRLCFLARTVAELKKFPGREESKPFFPAIGKQMQNHKTPL